MYNELQRVIIECNGYLHTYMHTCTAGGKYIVASKNGASLKLEANQKVAAAKVNLGQLRET